MILEEARVSILLFDGVCNLCNGTVNLLLDLDTKRRLKYASLQSEFARNLILEHHLEEETRGIDSILFWDGARIYSKSNAVLKIASSLGGIWRIFGLGYLVPGWIRNKIYDLVAKNRYRWFGRQEACRMPTPELKDRILG
ncbi:thiol-disulfide oxidoreductase DCC family protein [Leptospira semungkisensis]|uniref:Thiol-disulfide oxidoreductase DCC family protein n=1 Tax=Leptospira semungkisensis TaxID=2484985 RepID=A0A4R9FMH8_9LEPT|nr:thiol-disulfide oxidoreductase DCC family protein [Leptospira semungkisensis]TGJ99630.1 thiol-disulfide oxidoreductase DCC family protein [Leptospira semungkisensis]